MKKTAYWLGIPIIIVLIIVLVQVYNIPNIPKKQTSYTEEDRKFCYDNNNQIHFRDICLVNLVKIPDDSQICDEVLYNPLRYQCLAFANRDPTICEKINSSHQEYAVSLCKDNAWAYISVKIRENNESCANIEAFDIRRECYDAIIGKKYGRQTFYWSPMSPPAEEGKWW